MSESAPSLANLPELLADDKLQLSRRLPQLLATQFGISANAAQTATGVFIAELLITEGFAREEAAQLAARTMVSVSHGR